MNPEKLQYICRNLSIGLTVAIIIAYFSIYASIIQSIVALLLAGGSTIFIVPLVWWLILDSRKVAEKVDKKGA